MSLRNDADKIAGEITKRSRQFVHDNYKTEEMSSEEIMSTYLIVNTAMLIGASIAMEVEA